MPTLLCRVHACGRVPPLIGVALWQSVGLLLQWEAGGDLSEYIAAVGQQEGRTLWCRFAASLAVLLDGVELRARYR